MSTNDQVERDGFRWLVVAGLVAVAFSLFLVNADNMLSFSKREQELGKTLRELRHAQAYLPSRATDPRQIGSANEPFPDKVHSDESAH